MKLSLNWIKRYVDLPADLTMDKLAYDLTMCTVEVEDATNIGESLAGLVVGKILTVDKHPDADKLRVCTVDVGDPEPSVIVCGGINLAPQQLVAVAKPGAWVKWHGEGDPVEIKPAKLRGVMSYGMICASGEIGLADLFPTTQPAEIMDITEFAAAPGTPLAACVGAGAATGCSSRLAICAWAAASCCSVEVRRPLRSAIFWSIASTSLESCSRKASTSSVS